MFLNILFISTNLFDLPFSSDILNDNLSIKKNKVAEKEISHKENTKDDKNSIVIYTNLDSKTMEKKILDYLEKNSEGKKTEDKKTNGTVEIKEIGKKAADKKPAEKPSTETGKKEEEKKELSKIALNTKKNEGVVLEIAIRGTDGSTKNIKQEYNGQNFDKIYQDIKTALNKKDTEIKKLNDEKCKKEIKDAKNKSKLLDRVNFFSGSKKGPLDEIILKVQTITIAEKKKPVENITKTITQDIMKTVTHVDKRTVSLTISVDNRPVKTITVNDKKDNKKDDKNNKKDDKDNKKNDKKVEEAKKLQEKKVKELQKKNDKNVVGEGIKTTPIFSDHVDGKTFVSGDLKVGKEERKMKFLGYVQNLL